MKSVLLVLLLFLSGLVHGADVNGYTAAYECRAGGANCNVDVATYVAHSCDQTITTADSAATISTKINGGSQYICVTNGNYTAKGTITISVSGTSGARKVLRYTRSGDNDDEPWNQSSGNKAQVAGIHITGDYWIVHRLTFTAPLEFGADNGTGNNNIANRVLASYVSGFVVDNHGGNGVTIQNSVIRETGIVGAADRPCVGSGGATDFHVVNNEIYNCQGDEIIFQTTSSNDFAGGVIENNDLYITSAYQTNGGGTPGSGTSDACSENAIDIKGGGTSGSPVRIIHNRMWGHRNTDGNCADGSLGEQIIFHTGGSGSGLNSYGLIQNNIMFDGSLCISSPNFEPDHWSVIGNICYNMQGISAFVTYAYSQEGSTSTEAYLNQFILAAEGNSGGWINYGKDTGNDIRCNVAIDSGSTTSWGSGTSTQIDYNAYYGTTDSGETNKISKSITLKTAYTGCTTAGCLATENTTGLSVGDIVRTSSTPVTDCTSNVKHCYLYKVTSVGASGSIQAIRGPYSFYRKLRTGAEQVFIPYARPYAGAAEATLCPSTYNSRTSIGIGNGP